MQNELYRLTFCENVLKIALGTQPQRPQLASEGFPGRLGFWMSGGRPGKNDVMRCCVVVDLVLHIFDAGVVRAVAGSCTLSDCCIYAVMLCCRFPSFMKFALAVLTRRSHLRRTDGRLLMMRSSVVLVQ